MHIIRRIFLEDAGLKIWSLILAIIFWYAIQEEKETEAFVQVDVQLKNRPSNLIITNTVVDQINLGLRGYQAEIKRIQDKSLPSYEIDLVNATPGSALFRVFSSDFVLPQGVQITQMNPQLVTVELEMQLSKKLPVKVKFSGKLEKGFSVVDTLVEPNHVVVAGAKSIIDQLSQIDTEAVSLNGVRENFSTKLALDMPSSQNIWVNEDSYVGVNFEIKEEVISGIIEEIPIELRGGSQNLKVEPSLASVVVQGKAGLVNDMLKTKPRFSVSLTGQQLGQLQSKKISKLRLKPILEKLEGVEVIKAMPDRVVVKLN
jgi:YbbR domain-containing protein